jgi:hypothetical protein
MKTTTITLILLTLVSCDNKTKSDGDGAKPIMEKAQDDLTGEWGISVTGYEDFGDHTDVYCNECPQVIFRVNGTGTITFPGGATEQMEWTRDKDKLKIKNISAGKNQGEFGDGEYSMIFEKKTDFIELKLKQIETSYHLLLRR